jgi:transposase-like protein
MAKYGKKITKSIVELIKSDTFTIAEICQQVGITPSTFHEWQKGHEEFALAIQEAKESRMQIFVHEAKKSLMKKIQGYTVQERHTTMVNSKEIDPKTKKPKPKIKEQKVIDKHFQPDTALIIFTLCNGEPETWKNRQVAELTGRDGKDLFGKLTDEELEAKIAELERKNTQ